MHFNPEFMTNCFNENPILYNLKKESRLLKPPPKSGFWNKFTDVQRKSFIE